MPFRIGVLFTDGGAQSLIISSDSLQDAFVAVANLVDESGREPAALVTARTRGGLTNVESSETYNANDGTLEIALKVGRHREKGLTG